MLAPWKKSYDKPRQHIKKKRHYLTDKGPSSQSYGFSSSYVWMWELDYKESWALKNWCFWTVVLEKTLESPLDCKEIQPVHPKGDQSWVFVGRTDVEAETPVLWPPDVKSWLIWKDPDAGKDWRQEKKGMTGWDCWIASATQWTWVWVNSGSWWWIGRPGVLQSMGVQRVGHHWATELHWTGQQGDPTSQSSRKLTLNINWKDWCWSWYSNTLATWCKELTHLKRPWCWERLEAGGEGYDRGWELDGIIDSIDMSLGKLRELVMDGQGGLVGCSPWGCKELDTTEQLNWTELKKKTIWVFGIGLGCLWRAN